MKIFTSYEQYTDVNISNAIKIQTYNEYKTNKNDEIKAERNENPRNWAYRIEKFKLN